MSRFNVSCNLEAKVKKIDINLDELPKAVRVRAKLTDCYEAFEKTERMFVKQLDAESAEDAINFVKDDLFKHYDASEYCEVSLDNGVIHAHWDDCDYYLSDFQAEEIYDNEALKSLRSANKALKKLSQSDDLNKGVRKD